MATEMTESGDVVFDGVADIPRATDQCKAEAHQRIFAAMGAMLASEGLRFEGVWIDRYRAACAKVDQMLDERALTLERDLSPVH